MGWKHEAGCEARPTDQAAREGRAVGVKQKLARGEGVDRRARGQTCEGESCSIHNPVSTAVIYSIWGLAASEACPGEDLAGARLFPPSSKSSKIYTRDLHLFLGRDDNRRIDQLHRRALPTSPSAHRVLHLHHFRTRGRHYSFHPRRRRRHW